MGRLQETLAKRAIYKVFELRPYQEEIPPKVLSYFDRCPGKHPIVAAPTGSGKTVIIAELIRQALAKWPNLKVLVLTHVKEIIEQDHASLEKHLKGYEIGIYSAGMNRRDIKKVTVAGIQSVYKLSAEFKEYRLVIIDEAHMIPVTGNGMYRTFFKGMRNVRYFGMTATAYRLGTGLIYGDGDDTLFDELIYDLTSTRRFNKLIEDGYLCDLKTQATDVELDTTGIHIKGGDFANDEMSKAFDRRSITEKAVDEIIKCGKDYKKWLVFAIDIDHAEHIAEMLSEKGIPTMVIHSKMEFDRDTVIRSYKAGMFRCIVNVNVLTTGFDDPKIDLIALLRPTKSPVIHVQTIGRGLRICDGKPHCLILDFAGNTERLGPINDIHIINSRKRKGEGVGDPITKRCPECDTIHAPTVKTCKFCGHIFKFKSALQAMSSGIDVIAKKAHNGWYSAQEVVYAIRKKQNRPDTLEVKYTCGLRFFKEWVCIEHKGYAGYKAKHWAKFRGVEDCKTARELMDNSDKLKKPNRIKVDSSGKYPVITDFSF